MSPLSWIILAATPAPSIGPDLPGFSWVTIFWVAGLIGAMTIAALALHLFQLSRAVFGRKPAIEVELGAKADRGDVDKLSVDIKGFATAKELEAHNEEHRLRATGLEKQISDARHEFANQANVLALAARERAASNDQFMKELQAHLTQNDRQIAKLETSIEHNAGAIGNLVQKFDRLIERLAQAPPANRRQPT